MKDFNIFFDLESNGELHQRIPHAANPVTGYELIEDCVESIADFDFQPELGIKVVGIHVEEVLQG